MGGDSGIMWLRLGWATPAAVPFDDTLQRLRRSITDVTPPETTPNSLCWRSSASMDNDASLFGWLDFQLASGENWLGLNCATRLRERPCVDDGVVGVVMLRTGRLWLAGSARCSDSLSVTIDARCTSCCCCCCHSLAHRYYHFISSSMMMDDCRELTGRRRWQAVIMSTMPVYCVCTTLTRPYRQSPTLTRRCAVYIQLYQHILSHKQIQLIRTSLDVYGVCLSIIKCLFTHLLEFARVKQRIWRLTLTGCTEVISDAASTNG